MSYNYKGIEQRLQKNVSSHAKHGITVLLNVGCKIEECLHFNEMQLNLVCS